jgi:hypothetical protein
MINDKDTARFREAAMHNDHLLFIELANELKANMHDCIEGNDLIGLANHRDTLMHALKSVASQRHEHDHWGVQSEPFMMAIAYLLPFNSKAAFRHLGVYPPLDDYLLQYKINPQALGIVSEDYKVLLENCLVRQNYEVFEDAVVGLMRQIVELQPQEAVYRRVAYHVSYFLGHYPDVGEFSAESKGYLDQLFPRIALPSGQVYFEGMLGFKHAGLLKSLMWRIESTIDSIHSVDFYTKDEALLRSLYAFIKPELTTASFTKVAKAMLNSSGALGRKMLAVEVFGGDHYAVDEFTVKYLDRINQPDALYLLIEQYLIDHPVPTAAARARIVHVLNAAIENDVKNKAGFTPERFEQVHRIPKSFYSETDWDMVNQLEGDLGL